MHAPSIHEIYERWAPRYPAEPHNPLMTVEQRLMLGLLPPLAELRILDMACGSGRYAQIARQLGAAQVVALDFSMTMLGKVRGAQRVRGDLCALPLRDGAFDFVISGLALGHAADLDACFAEIARTLVSGGTLLYSDFHPLATQHGLTRSFTDVDGQKLCLPPGTFDRDAHFHGLRKAGLILEQMYEPRVGFEFDEPFSGSERFYRDWRGVPILLVARARKP